MRADPALARLAVRIRAGGEADAAAIAAVIVRAFASYTVRLDPPPSALHETAATIAARLAEELALVAECDGRIVGFIVSVRDGETALAYHIGFDREIAGEGVPLYLRLLHASLGQAIEYGARRVSFGRTALEPKARLGCKPEATIVWARHRHPFLNQLLQPMLKLVEHDVAPDVAPFKEA